jgi:hypothetical protein
MLLKFQWRLVACQYEVSMNCYIGEYRKDGTIRAIYCHYDGYLATAGYTLWYFYKEREKVNQLLALGDLVELGDVIEPSETERHCVAYGRDRGRSNKEAREFANLGEFMATCASSGYLYLFDGAWRYCYGVDETEFKTLTRAAVEGIE